MISRFSRTILPQQGGYRAHYVNRFRDLLRAMQFQILVKRFLTCLILNHFIICDNKMNTFTTKNYVF